MRTKTDARRTPLPHSVKNKKKIELIVLPISVGVYHVETLYHYP